MIRPAARALLCCLLALLLAFSVCACAPEPAGGESSSGPDVQTSVQESLPAVESGEPSGGESDENDGSFPQKTYGMTDFSVDGTVFVRSGEPGREDPVLGVLPENEISSPYIHNVYLTAERAAVAAVVDKCELSSGVAEVTFRLFRYDEVQETWISCTEEAEAVPFDKNTNNRDGRFGIEYGKDAVKGKPCPYVVLYYAGNTDKVLYYKERAEEYPRIVRQDDRYAILSLLHGEERDYAVIDAEGNRLYTFIGEDDVFESVPLTFRGDTLLCKTDSDEDFEYDTLEAVDLTSGTRTVLQTFGNCGYWTYSSDGKTVAVYDVDIGGTKLYVCDTDSNTVRSLELTEKAVSVDPAGSALLIGFEDGTRELADPTGYRTPFPIPSGIAPEALLHTDTAVLFADGSSVTVLLP